MHAPNRQAELDRQSLESYGNHYARRGVYVFIISPDIIIDYS